MKEIIGFRDLSVPVQIALILSWVVAGLTLVGVFMPVY